MPLADSGVAEVHLDWAHCLWRKTSPRRFVILVEVVGDVLAREPALRGNVRELQPRSATPCEVKAEADSLPIGLCVAHQFGRHDVWPFDASKKRKFTL